MRNDENAAIAAATALLTEPVEDVVEPVVEQVSGESPEAPQVTEDQPLFPEFEIELPEDLQEELTAPTEEDVVGELEGTEEYDELNEEGQRLLARARFAERKAEHYEKLRTVDAQKNWAEEAKKFFPLSAHVLSEIKADSRRGFLKAAKEAHDAVVPYVKQITDTAKATIETEKEKAKAEARAEAEAAWGRPAKPVEGATEATITQEQVERNRAKGDLSSTIKAMIFPGKKED